MVREFVSWVKKKRLDEGIWGNWTYEVPIDPKQQMYDFYMLEYLLPHGIGLYLTVFDFDPDENKQGEIDPETGKAHGEPAMPLQRKFNMALYEVANKLLPALKKELLKAVEFAVAAELRHIEGDSLENIQYGGSYKERLKMLIQTVKEKRGKADADLLRRYFVAYKQYMGGETKEFMPRDPLDPLYDYGESGKGGTHQEYRRSFRAMKDAGGSTEQWMSLASWLFTNAEWNEAYGGKNWALIADAWGHLYHAKAAHEIITYIDHVYDLQHNTGSVFTKLPKFSKNGSFKWIEKALDHKRDMVAPHEFIEHLSKPMQELALIGIKLKTGKTFGDFEADWPEIVKKKTEIHNYNMEKKWEKEKEKYFSQKARTYYEQQLQGWEAEKKNYLKNNPGGEFTVPKPTRLSAEDYQKKFPHQTFYNPKPSPISVDTFERNVVTDTGSPYSVARLTKHHKLGQDSRFSHLIGNGTPDVPKKITDYHPGDQVSTHWPPREWLTVTGIRPASFEGATEYLDIDGFALRLDRVKGYLSKDAKNPAQISKPPQEPVYDYHNKQINVGDRVKQFSSSTDKSGQVEKIANGWVYVKWDDGISQKAYMPYLLVVLKDIKDKNGKVIKVGDTVTYSGYVTGAITKISDSGIVTVKSPSGIAGQYQASDLEKIEKAKELVDKHGKPIKVGDLVKWSYGGGRIRQIIGNQIKIDFHGDVITKTANELELITSPMEAKDFNGKNISVGDKVIFRANSEFVGKATEITPLGEVKVKWDQENLGHTFLNGSELIVQVPTPQMPAPAPQPSSTMSSIKLTWDDLKGVPVVLRFVRTIKAIYTHSSIENYVKQISQAVGVPVEEKDMVAIKKMFWEEDTKEKYYKQRGMALFPHDLKPNDAVKVKATNYPSPPPVFLDHLTGDKVEAALLAHKNEEAVKIVQDKTKFGTVAAKGLVILFKLDLFANGMYQAA